MSMRGVRKGGAKTITSAVRGQLRDPGHPGRGDGTHHRAESRVSTARSPRTSDGCRVMGVVNVTPDSFSDGGQWLDADTAVQHGLELVAEGADLVDVGGESTRPGALRIDAEEELRRVIPVVTGLVGRGRHRVGRHDARRGRGAGARGRCGRSSTTSRAAAPTRA